MAQVGALLDGRYRLEEVIGEGAMAGVWRGFDRLLERPVAIKLLRPEFSSDQEVLERFRREARLAAVISHPNVVSVFDYAAGPDAAYMIMRLVEGPDLASVLARRGRLPVDHALRVAAAVSDGLQAAHDVGLVHRDIKPGNILLDADGEVRVVDFGIARAIGEARTTHPNAIMASIRYCSPEQVTGEPVGAASDVYSLGLVLHELLTGVPPFPGSSPATIALARLRTRPLPPSTVAEDVPESIDPLLMRALDPDPRHRYPSARAFGDAIREWFGDRGEPAVAGVIPEIEPAPTEVPESPTPVSPSVVRPVQRPRRAAVIPHRRASERRRLAALAALLPVLALLIVAASAWVLLGLPDGLRLPGDAAPTGGVLGVTATPGETDAALEPVPSATASASPSAVAVVSLTPPPSTPSPTLAATPSPTSVVTPSPVPTQTPRPESTPTPTQTPDVEPAGEPAPRLGPGATISRWYTLVEQHRFREAAALWSPRMREEFPPRGYIDGRFSRTTRIDIHRAEVVFLDRDAGRAVVEVDLTEHRSVEPSPRRFVGSWELIRTPQGWLMDEPHF
jgi:serine/threonine-protein kinase